MISRILFRLSIAWFAVLALIWVWAVSSGGHPELFSYFFMSLPAIVGIVLGWVFLPPKR